MSVHLTKENVLAGLEAAVARRGADFRYGDAYPGHSCVYVLDGKPACLVGEMLINDFGISAEEFDGLNDISAHDLSAYLDVDMTPEAANILNQAQCSQDNNLTWGQALEEAKDEDQ